jgi:hypothetical protein
MWFFDIAIKSGNLLYTLTQKLRRVKDPKSWDRLLLRYPSLFYMTAQNPLETLIRGKQVLFCNLSMWSFLPESVSIA